MKHKNHTKDHFEMLLKYKKGDRVVIRNVNHKEINNRAKHIGMEGTVAKIIKCRCELLIHLDNGTSWGAYVQNVEKKEN